MLERRFGPFVTDSILITEAIPGAADLETYLRRAESRLAPAEWYREKRALSKLLSRQLRRLEERGFGHRDCKSSNILVVEQPQRKLLWIDMDGLRQIRRDPGRRWEKRALVALHVSLLDIPGLSQTDRVRFLKSFTARFGADPRAWRAIWRELTPAVQRKIRAKERRRDWKLRRYGRE